MHQESENDYGCFRCSIFSLSSPPPSQVLILTSVTSAVKRAPLPSYLQSDSMLIRPNTCRKNFNFVKYSDF